MAGSYAAACMARRPTWGPFPWVIDELVLGRHVREHGAGSPYRLPLVGHGQLHPPRQQCIAAQGHDDPHGL